MQAAVHVGEGEGLIRIRVLHTQIGLWAHRLCLLWLAEDQARHVGRLALIVLRSDVVPPLRRGGLLRLAGWMISRSVCLQRAQVNPGGVIGLAHGLIATAWVGVS